MIKQSDLQHKRALEAKCERMKEALWFGLIICLDAGHMGDDEGVCASCDFVIKARQALGINQ